MAEAQDRRRCRLGLARGSARESGGKVENVAVRLRWDAAEADLGNEARGLRGDEFGAMLEGGKIFWRRSQGRRRFSGHEGAQVAKEFWTVLLGADQERGLL